MENGLAHLTGVGGRASTMLQLLCSTGMTGTLIFFLAGLQSLLSARKTFFIDTITANDQCCCSLPERDKREQNIEYVGMFSFTKRPKLFRIFDSLLQKVMRRRVIKLGSNFAESCSTVQNC